MPQDEGFWKDMPHAKEKLNKNTYEFLACFQGSLATILNYEQAPGYPFTPVDIYEYSSDFIKHEDGGTSGRFLGHPEDDPEDIPPIVEAIDSVKSSVALSANKENYLKLLDHIDPTPDNVNLEEILDYGEKGMIKFGKDSIVTNDAHFMAVLGRRGDEIQLYDPRTENENRIDNGKKQLDYYTWDEVKGAYVFYLLDIEGEDEK